MGDLRGFLENSLRNLCENGPYLEEELENNKENKVLKPLVTSKQPWKLYLTSDLKFMAQTTYATIFV